MMGYGGYGMGGGGFGLGFIGPIINIIILLVIIWGASSLFNNRCRRDGGDDDSRIARLERETERTRDTLEKILRKLD